MARDHGFAYLDCPVADRLERVSLCAALDVVTPSFEPLQCTFVRSARRELVFVSRRLPHHATSIRVPPDVGFRFVELIPERSGPLRREVLVGGYDEAGTGRRVPWTIYRYANPGGGLPLPNDFHLDARVIVRRGPRGSFEAATLEQLARRRDVGASLGPYEQQLLRAARRTRMACYDLRRERYFERVMTLDACVAANEGAR